MQGQSPQRVAQSNTPSPVCVVDLRDSSGQLTPAQIAFLLSNTRRACQLLASDYAVICGGSFRICVVDDAAMSIAHERHSGIPGPTDVLTFDLRDAQQLPLDTDLLIDVDEARRQATRRNVTIEAELLLYVIHGVLHCLGFDDHDETGYQVMHAMEDRILTELGVGAIFSAPEQPGGET